jgi:hypothetical protein
MDALGPQQERAQPMRAQEAAAVLALQGHQGTWPEEVARLLAWADAQPDRDVVHMSDVTQNTGHGREERRRPTVTHALTGRRGYQDGGGGQTVAMGEAWRPQGDAVSDERRDDSRRLGREAQRLAERVRGHGALENALHWGLDLACREDDRRMRQGHAPANLARLRRMALNRLTQEQTNRHGVKVKRHRAGWDNDD